MSDTYIGWDGKSYPWPPPEGWYHASDGRWWAPATGPNPPPSGGLLTSPPADPPSFAQNTAPYEDPSLARAGAYDPPVRTGPSGPSGPSAFDPPPRDPTAAYDAPAARGGTLDLPPPSAFDRPGPFETAAMPKVEAPSAFGPGTAPPPGFGPGGSGPGGNAPGGPGFDPDPYGAPGAPGRPSIEPGGRGLPLPFILAGLVGVVIIGVAAFFLLARGGGDETATDNSTTTPPVTADPGATTAPTVPGATTIAPAGTETTVPADPAATTIPADGSTTLAPVGTDLVANFRGILVNNGLTSDELSASEIEAFGSTFCIFASTSETREEFDTFRQEAIDEANSALDAESLGLVIDTAVVVFCPEDATRLGITAP